MASSEERSGVADPAERDENLDAHRDAHPDSFDPGVETGYLRRARRDHDLDLDQGAAPFDPGDGHYDDRRAKREAKRREKEEQLRRTDEQRRADERGEMEAEERRRAEEAERERERAEREREREEERFRDEEERERRAEEIEAIREESEREEAGRAERALAERERLREAQLAEREAREHEREERKRAEREERDHAFAEEEEIRRAEREERDRRDREAREERERRRAERKSRKASGKRPRRRGRRPAAARPAAKARPKRAAAEVAVKRGPRPRRKAPPARLEGERPGPSLRRPTLKAAVAIAGVTATALAFGAAVGLPLPLVGGETDKTPASVTPNEVALAGITEGTPVGLTAGPYHPVVKPTGYGEGAARFGAPRGGRKHEGQDVFGAPGTPLVAIRDGIVLDGAGGRNFYSTGGGNTLVLYSPLDDRSYVYLHMLKPALVKAGDEVKAGQLVGLLGCTGSCDGPHLHFEVRNGRAYWGAETKAVDPLPLVRSWPQRPAAEVKPAAPQKGEAKTAPAAPAP